MKRETLSEDQSMNYGQEIDTTTRQTQPRISTKGLHINIGALGYCADKTIYFPDFNEDVEIESESTVELATVFVPYSLLKAYVDLVERRKQTGL